MKPDRRPKHQMKIPRGMRRALRDRNKKAPLKVTEVMRRKVSMAAGAGMVESDIARALDMSPVTLRRHFSEELSSGAAKSRMVIVEALYAQASKGNVGAARAYATMFTPVAEPPKPPKSPEGLPAIEHQSPQPMLEGKKARANTEALTAHVGTPWESLLAHTAPARNGRSVQ